MDDLHPHEINSEKVKSNKSRLLWWSFIVVDLLIILIALLGWWLIQPPRNSVETEIVIEPGQTVSSIADELAIHEVVKSADILYLFLQVRYPEAVIKAGTYTFPANATVFSHAKILAETTPADELVRLTLPEGMRARDYASIATNIIEDFDPDVYTTLGEMHEGYLWPETYFVPHDYAPTDLIALQKDKSQSVLTAYSDQIASSSLSEYEVLTLASIVEREANSPESMAMVAGILQNRLAIGMALQADASIEYVLDTPLGELPPGVLASELRERSSPYNTYLNTGLPPTPIGNPGEQAIRAVVEPMASDYLFYITGSDGNFYYAETFDQHRLNIGRYLR